MIYSIQSYKDQEQSFTIPEAANIHQKMIEEIGEDEKALELYEAVKKAGVEYIEIRTKWAILPKGERKAINDLRTEKHNAVIDSLDVLCEYLRSVGHNAVWRDEIGYEKDGKYFRKRIGDFGCYIAFLLSLSTR